MIIMKFGGTSLENEKRKRKTAEIIKSRINLKPVVVVSAVAKITDKLIDLANECAAGKGEAVFDNIKKIHLDIINQLNLDNSLLNEDFSELSQLAEQTRQNRKSDTGILDNFQSFGERLSSKIVSEYLNKNGIYSQTFNSWDMGLRTNNDFGNAEPLESSYSNIKNNIIKSNSIPVITGFIGKSEENQITTFGRGGSDYSAAIFGSAIDADEIQIWTDVDGVMTADPKIVKNAKPVRQVSFAEASELAYFGARVLHPKTILPAMRKNIPVRVLNSFNPDNKGTAIVMETDKNSQPVKAIAYKKGISLINIDSTRMLGAYGFLAMLFGVFDKYKKSVDIVATSEISVSLSVDDDSNLKSIAKDLESIANVEIIKDKAIICIVGEGMKHTVGISGRTFTAMGKNNINIEVISQGASEINITFVVDGKDAEKAAMALHDEFFG